MHACRLLLEEQTSRNTLLEKKQRKFDAEIGSLNEELRRESEARDKVARELDEAKRSKFLLEDEVQVGGKGRAGERVGIAKKLRARQENADTPFFLFLPRCDATTPLLLFEGVDRV